MKELINETQSLRDSNTASKRKNKFLKTMLQGGIILMNNTTSLKAGDKIEIILNENSKDVEFLSKVEEICSNDTFVTSRPISNDGYSFLPLNKSVKVEFFRENGLYCFNSEAVEVIKNRATFSVMMKILSGVHKLQRRNFYRLQAFVQLKINCKTDNKVINMKCNTADISGGGVKALFFRRIDKGTIIKMFIKIPGIEDQQILGKVVRCLPSMKDVSIFEIGIEFVDINSQTRQTILKYIIKKEREIIKNIRFLNGE